MWRAGIGRPRFVRQPPNRYRMEQDIPYTITSEAMEDERCPGCLDPLHNNENEPAVTLATCNHACHRRCLLHRVIHEEPRCFRCDYQVPVTPACSSPPGTLTIQFSGDIICPGFYPITTGIVITYHIPAGTQLSYHPTPNAPYPGTIRTAYLPNTEEGRCLLMRFIRAFVDGLTFTIGTSMTTGAQNVVVWTPYFNHKTSLHGGEHAFPDNTYIDTCNAQLDAIGVPRLGPPNSWAHLHNQVIPYIAPSVQRPPSVSPDVLLPCVPAIHATTGRLGVSVEQDLQDYGTIAEAAVVDDVVVDVEAPEQEVAAARVPADNTHRLASSTTDEPCALCGAPLWEAPTARIQTCNHKFHERCIRHWLSHQQQQPHCPLCHVEVGVAPPAKSPSGTMTIQFPGDIICPGFYPITTCIIIIYHIPAGTQHAFHDNPNTPYRGTTRTAYLPNTEEGRRLLMRLIRAYYNGLTFTIGTSLTTGRQNVVVWTTYFNHKTSLNGGEHGFPDYNYIGTCNAQLDAIGVPTWNPSDPMVLHNQVIPYNAPSVLGFPRLLPDVLLPVARAIDTETSIVGRLRMGAQADFTMAEAHVVHDDTALIEVTAVLQGMSPSGTMSIRYSVQPCPGFPNTTCIVITYHIPGGTQLSFHENPGIPYAGTTRTACLPNNVEGRRLLMRLIRAFVNGLTFTVGTSMTTGRPNVVVWTTYFNHKTSLNGGEHGFPDTNYIANCNAQLDAIGVPRWDPTNPIVPHNEVISYNAPRPVASAPRATNENSNRNRWSSTTRQIHNVARFMERTTSL